MGLKVLWFLNITIVRN